MSFVEAVGPPVEAGKPAMAAAVAATAAGAVASVAPAAVPAAGAAVGFEPTEAISRTAQRGIAGDGDLRHVEVHTRGSPKDDVPATLFEPVRTYCY